MKKSCNQNQMLAVNALSTIKPVKPSVSGIAIYVCMFLFLSSGVGAADKLPVFVSIAPQQYFVQQIGKALVDVEVMIPAGADPHIYEPKPRQMVALSGARLYFAIGVQPFEKILLKKIAAAHPNLRVIHTDQGIQKIPMAAHGHSGDDNHPDEAESPEKGRREEGTEQREGGELDPHIWLSPPLVRQQVQTMLNALVETDPGNRSAYEANYRLFVSELMALDAELENLFAGKQGLQFMVLHPAWGYFAQTYGLKQVPVEIEGKDPKPAQLKELIEHAKQKQIKIIFVQPQFSPRSAQLVAKEIGGQVVFADPLAAGWSDNLREVARKFETALK